MKKAATLKVGEHEFSVPTRTEVRRRLCQCGKWLSLVVILSDDKIVDVRFKEDPSINMFSKYGECRSRRVGQLQYVFVFCAACNRRAQIRMFKP